MAAWSGGSIHCCLLLLLLLLPTLLLAQDDCSHNCKNEANRYYYVRPEGSAETLCPAQPCLTPSQLRDHFSECERNISCQTINTSLVLLPGTYSLDSNNRSFIPQLNFLSLTGYNEDCITDSSDTPSIDCNGNWISLMFQHLKCLQVRNCAVFTGHGTNVEVDRVTFHDSFLRLASITAATHSELDYNYTLGSESYCLLQKQLADMNFLTTNHSVLAFRNVSFSSDYHTACAREYGIQLTTIDATDSALDIADCLFTQNAITHISLFRSTLCTSGMVQFEHASTAIKINSSKITLAGVVNFSHANKSAIRALDTHSTILLTGTVEFTNNTAFRGGAVSMAGGNITIPINAHVVFQGNSAKLFGGAISCKHAVFTIAGSVQFTNNSGYLGGAIGSLGIVTIADNAQTIFQGNRAKDLGGAISSLQHVTIAGSVQFNNNSAHKGGAVNSVTSVTITDNAQVIFQSNHADLGGAIIAGELVTIEGSSKFIKNSAYQGSAIYSNGNVTITDIAEVVFQGNHANLLGAITSRQHVTIAGSVHFINNSADQGGAIHSNHMVTVADSAHAVFQRNHAKDSGGAISSGQHVNIAGTVQFFANSADQGGAINANGNVTIADNAHVKFQGNHAKTYGGAISSILHITIAGTVQFINNSAYDDGGAISTYDGVTIVSNGHLVFQGNHATNIGGAIMTTKRTAIAGSAEFINNSANYGGAIASGGNVTIDNNSQVDFVGNRANNTGGAILAFYNDNLLLAGSVQFISNTALLGGAISKFKGKMTVANNSKVVFRANHAYNVGGAIFTSASSMAYSGLIGGSCLISLGINSTIDFLDNTAERGGSAMYGTTMSKMVCLSLAHNYEYLFDIITITPDSFSAVSSDPLRVCICPDQSTPDCLAILPDQNTPHLHYTVYPGQNFTIPAAVVGINFALTSGSVYAQFLSSDASLGSDSQYVQGVNQTGCSQLQYSVLSDKKQETLVLATNGRQVTGIDNSIKEDIRVQNNNSISKRNYIQYPNPNKYYIDNTFMTNLTDGIFRLAGNVRASLQNTPVFISVQLLDCPPGFTLTSQYRCDCNERIRTNLLTCNINNQTVRRHGNIWVNATFTGNTSNGAIVHKHCPFQYCKPEQLDVNLTHPETQCAFDHYGTLCGACKPNFSLALGGSQCLPNCSNKYLLLLIVFVLGGFALVFFIKILNLTVSQGTINGLIFYANIVAANRSIFFPAHHNILLSFLSVFISWLNLDLGIETCFIKGLDGYWKTWLQFVFPFYVCLIAAAIILVSHYSTRATKVFGDKSVSVLATLILLSYAKLLRSIITIFSFTTLEFPDNITANVWSYDGNLQYLSSQHIPLFLFALITLLILWLPYTAVLLSAQWLRTQTHRKGLRWLKPFLDAYYGPFKDKHHYWVGVLLVVRGVLSVFFACFFAVENNVNLLLISITSLAIPIYTSFTRRLYKKLYTTILENICFLNLGTLGIGTLYSRLVSGNQEALVTTSVGIAFLQFCGIIIFHSYISLSSFPFESGISK